MSTEGWFYWSVRATILMRDGAEYHTTDAHAWWQRVLARGYKVITTVGGKKVPRPAIDPNTSEPFGDPVLHYTGLVQGQENLAGQLIPFNPDTGQQDPAAAQFYEFETKFSRPFGLLGLI